MELVDGMTGERVVEDLSDMKVEVGQQHSIPHTKA